jgi:hypothetical protein
MLLVSKQQDVLMIFRALLAIGAVVLLTPHEPDLGLGRPGAGALQTSPTAISQPASGLSRAKDLCEIPACAGALAFGLTPKEGRPLRMCNPNSPRR